ncbi:MAG: hypothetical protein EOO41_04555, partial [Methanobacteriota archaeon]
MKERLVQRLRDVILAHSPSIASHKLSDNIGAALTWLPVATATAVSQLLQQSADTAAHPSAATDSEPLVIGARPTAAAVRPHPGVE